MKRTFSFILPAAFGALLVSNAAAQTTIVPTVTVPEPTIDQLAAQGSGIVHFVSNLGSFKVINGEGRLEFEFKGTVLVSKLEGKVTPSSGLRVEYDKDGRKIFTGTGRLIIEGKWRGVQWFGSNVRGTWWGKGDIRVVGEFDKNLQTGDYWFEKADERQSWPANGTITIHLPKGTYGKDADVVPKERKKGG